MCSLAVLKQVCKFADAPPSERGSYTPPFWIWLSFGDLSASRHWKGMLTPPLVPLKSLIKSVMRLKARGLPI